MTFTRKICASFALAACAACAASGAPAPDANDGMLTNESPPPADTGSLAACAKATVVAKKLPVYMLIVLDGSGSMISFGKWNAAIGALGSFFDAAQARADEGLAVGLTVFSDTRDRTQGYGPYPDVDVPIGFVTPAQAASLKERLARGEPAYETPMAAVLVGQFPRIEQFVAGESLSPGGKKVLLLMTDGVPYPNAQTQRPVVLDTVRAETGKSITTVVVGIGSARVYDPLDYDPRFLAQVAMSGGASRAGCDPTELLDVSRMCHVQITPEDKTTEQLQEDLSRAINDVRSALASCELSLDVTGDIDPRKVNVVYVDARQRETLLLQDPQNGWTWDDAARPTKIELHGRACSKLKAEPDGLVRVVVGCRSAVK